MQLYRRYDLSIDLQNSFVNSAVGTFTAKFVRFGNGLESSLEFHSRSGHTNDLTKIEFAASPRRSAQMASAKVRCCAVLYVH